MKPDDVPDLIKELRRARREAKLIKVVDSPRTQLAKTHEVSRQNTSLCALREYPKDMFTRLPSAKNGDIPGVVPSCWRQTTGRA